MCALILLVIMMFVYFRRNPFSVRGGTLVMRCKMDVPLLMTWPIQNNDLFDDSIYYEVNGNFGLFDHKTG